MLGSDDAWSRKSAGVWNAQFHVGLHCPGALPNRPCHKVSVSLQCPLSAPPLRQGVPHHKLRGLRVEGVASVDCTPGFCPYIIIAQMRVNAYLDYPGIF